MRVIILSQYFPPETGAPQNRLHSLALNLLSKGVEVEVIAAMPSYPKSRVFDGYRRKLFLKEILDGIVVRRSWIFVTQRKNVFPRLLNYFSFVFSALINGLFAKRSDFLICESPPLFLGITAYLLCKLKGARLIFNVSDLWPESAEKLDIVTNRYFLKKAYKLESFLYLNSTLVTGQTMGIVHDIENRFPNVKCHWLPNGIDRELYENIEISEDWKRVYTIQDKKIFVYAGIIGHAQALHIILEARALMMERQSSSETDETAFVIIGDGPDKDRLLALQEKLGTDVIFIPNTPKRAALSMVASCFAYVIPLKNIDLFKGAIPSKIFDPLAFGIPILLAVDGEARKLFIEDGKAGLYVEPENARSLLTAIQLFLNQPEKAKVMGASGRKYVQKHFDRSELASDFLNLLRGL